MNKKQIDKFFSELARYTKGMLKGRIDIILTGAACANLLGGTRPSLDIDFCFDCDRRYLDNVEEAIKHISRLTGIAVNFSEDIDRWSQISFLDYKKHTVPYKVFGSVKVSLLSPDYWSIGKITRYLDPDIDDLVRVLKNNPLPCLKLIRLWGKALLKSPHSSACFSFRMHVEHFLKTYGKIIWVKDFKEDKALETFWKTCGIKR